MVDVYPTLQINIFIVLLSIINMIQKTHSSQRQLLINRAKRFQLSQRLKNNIQEIQQKTQKLSNSRCSSFSIDSRRSSKLNYSMQVRQKSPKIRILQSIVDKLKCTKVVQDRNSEISTQDNILREDFQHLLTKKSEDKRQIENQEQKGVLKSPTRHKNKLQTMLKGIKKCNQQSTKAVSTIKKGFPKNKQETPNQVYPHIKLEKCEPSDEVNLLKQQLRRIKEQNKLLIQIIKINQLNTQVDGTSNNKCSACGCACSNKTNKVASFVESKTHT